MQDDVTTWAESCQGKTSNNYTEMNSEIDDFGFPIVILRAISQNMNTLFVKISQGMFYTGENLTFIENQFQPGFWMRKKPGKS